MEVVTPSDSALSFPSLHSVSKALSFSATDLCHIPWTDLSDDFLVVVIQRLTRYIICWWIPLRIPYNPMVLYFQKNLQKNKTLSILLKDFQTMKCLIELQNSTIVDTSNKINKHSIYTTYLCNTIQTKHI